MKHLGSLLLLALASTRVVAQSPEPFVSLFDGKTLAGWTVSEDQYAKNFSVKDGLLRVEGTGGWLKSAKEYSDFVLKLEARYPVPMPITNSGIFMRTSGKVPLIAGWPFNSYEIRLTSRTTGAPAGGPGDPRWAGGILNYGAPNVVSSFDTEVALQAYKITGGWHTYEIQAVAQTIVSIVNGRVVGRAYNLGNPSGLIGIQCESGTVEFRSIQIREVR